MAGSMIVPASWSKFRRRVKTSRFRSARVDSYPVQERWGYIWVFRGDLSESDRPELLDFLPEYDEQMLKTIHFGLGEDLAIVEQLKPVIAPPTTQSELFLETDLMESLYRRKALRFRLGSGPLMSENLSRNASTRYWLFRRRHVARIRGTGCTRLRH